MRSGLNPNQFFKKMKKKPALQAILDNLDDYTEEDLAEMSGQPLWIRECLVRLKKNNGVHSLDPSEIADLMTAQHVVEEDRTHEWYLWKGEPMFLGHNNRGISSTLEVDAGDTILILSFEKVMVNSSVIEVDHRSLALIVQNSQKMGRLTLDSYRQAAREARNNKLRT